MHVLVIAGFAVLREALAELVTSLGFTAHTEDDPEVEVALAYLARTAPPYPRPLRCRRSPSLPGVRTRSSGCCSAATAAA